MASEDTRGVSGDLGPRHVDYRLAGSEPVLTSQDRLKTIEAQAQSGVERARAFFEQQPRWPAPLNNALAALRKKAGSSGSFVGLIWQAVLFIPLFAYLVFHSTRLDYHLLIPFVCG